MEKEQNWLSNKKALFVTSNHTDRSGWRKILKDYGVDHKNVFNADSFQAASHILEHTPCEIIFCSFQLEGSRGQELYELHKKACSLRSETVFIFVSEVNSMSITAICGELEVDGLIVKPYNLKDISHSLQQIISRKVALSPFRKSLYEIQSLLIQERYHEALEGLKLLTPLKNEYKVLTLSMLGEIYFKLTEFQKSCLAFDNALELSPLHHKTLGAAHLAYMENKEYSKAYKCVAQILKNYPLNPEKISAYLKVLIATKNYQDVIEFSENLVKAKDLMEPVKIEVAAGLSMASKYLLKNNQKNFARKSATKVIELGIKQPIILSTAMNTLIDLGDINPVRNMLLNIPTEDMDENLLIVDFKLQDKLEAAGLVFKRGIELTTKNIHAPDIYEILIRRAKELKRTPEQIDDLVFNASKFNPKLKKHFESIK